LRKFFVRDCFGTQVYPISIEKKCSAVVVALSDSARRSSAGCDLDDASHLAVDVAAVAAVAAAEHYWTRNDLMDSRTTAASHEEH